ncbi:MAG: hypothetical protein JO148_07755 [Acidimicrobiia bacterium]|nr:hypothetical protein [Acidimicrobiia bacterium]
MAMTGRNAAALALALLLTAGACGGGSATTAAPSTDPGKQSAGDPSKAVAPPAAGIVADNGFRPQVHGLPFENYGPTLPDGSTPTNMTPDYVRTMFGDRVCVDALTGKCDLTPEAQDWLDSVNEDMASGHCYGFSVAAELLWQRRLDVAKFGAPATPRLDIENSKTLQRQIATAWVMQLLDSVRTKAVGGSANDVLGPLRKALVPNPSETYTVVFFKPDGSAGHAVTPYAIEDKGSGKFDVLIYDNNWPAVPRAMHFDTKADTWSYDAAINPKQRSELYTGDAKSQSIFLFPTSPGLGVQPCPFCGKRQKTTRGGANVASTATDEIFLDGSDTDHAQLLITDDAGHRLGYVHGKLVNEIPGARVEEVVANEDWMEHSEPRFVVPAGARYTIHIDASGLHHTDTETIGFVSPDADASVKDVRMHPGDNDTLVVGADGTTFSYTTSTAKPWAVTAGVSDDNADYAVDLRGASDSTHKTINAALPVDAGTVTMDRGPTAQGPSTVDLTVVREMPTGSQTFVHNGLVLDGPTAVTQSLNS